MFFMKVIGAGFSRTGTYSLKQALELLGFAPCYHGETIFQRPDHVGTWADIAKNQPDWQTFLGSYEAGVDSPICFYWKEVLAAFPNAKVILTTRDPNDWYESFAASLYQAMIHPDRAPEEIRDALKMAKTVVIDQFFEGRFSDREHAISIYTEHITSVRQHFSGGNEASLLVFDVKEGWLPLCRFLDFDIPHLPFPNTNSRSEFQQLFRE